MLIWKWIFVCCLIGFFIGPVDLYIIVLSPTQTFEEKCKSISWESYYSKVENKCYRAEGLTDISTDLSCNSLENGKILGQKTAEQLEEIVKNLRTVYGLGNLRMTVQLNENLQADQNVIITHRIPMQLIRDGATDVKFAIRFAGGEARIGNKIKHTPLVIAFDAPSITGLNVQWQMYIYRVESNKVANQLTSEATFGISRQNDGSESVLIAVSVKYTSDQQFKITAGHNTETYQFYDHEIAFINRYSLNYDGNPMSVMVNDKEIMLDLYFTDCLVVGVTRLGNVWFWSQSNKIVDSNLWDINEPSAVPNRVYGCINIHTNKLKAFPGYLMKYIICEYEGGSTAETVTSPSSSKSSSPSSKSSPESSFSPPSSSKSSPSSSKSSPSSSNSSPSSSKSSPSSSNSSPSSLESPPSSSNSSPSSSESPPSSSNSSPSSSESPPSSSKSSPESSFSPPSSSKSSPSSSKSSPSSSNSSPSSSKSSPSSSNSSPSSLESPPSSSNSSPSSSESPPSSSNSSPSSSESPPSSSKSSPESSFSPPSSSKSSPSSSKSSPSSSNSSPSSSKSSPSSSNSSPSSSESPPSSSNSAPSSSVSPPSSSNSSPSSVVYNTTTEHSPPLITTTPSFFNKANRVVGQVAQSLGCSSLICSCSAVIAIFLFLREFSYERCLHMSQELCLLCGHLLVVSFWDKHENKLLCKIATIGKQLFFVALFNFLSLEAFHNYTITTCAIRSGAWLKRWMCQLIGWSIAVVFVVITGVLNYDSLTARLSCWTNYEVKSVWLFTVAPIMVACCTAVVLTEAAGMDMNKRRPSYGYNRSQRKTALFNHIAMMTLLPLQAASFFCGSLAVFHFNQNELFYLCDISFFVNIALSVEIFIFHCLGNAQAYALLQRWFPKLFCRKGKKDLEMKPRYVYIP